MGLPEQATGFRLDLPQPRMIDLWIMPKPFGQLPYK